MSSSLDAVVARLRRQIRSGELILFTGAGFSHGAKNKLGINLPVGDTLALEFWKLAFPGDSFESRTSLGDVYHAAKKRRPKELLTLIRSQLAVETSALPKFFQSWFAFPWLRAYTLNIDDLELAAGQNFRLDRGVRARSATSDATNGDRAESALEVIHLNGMLDDDLDHLTFSDLDYASRTTRPDLWYNIWSSDVLSKPVIFVGTELNEWTLWQYVEFRKEKARGTREFRPGSCLISPTLNAARRVLLDDLNVDWIPMTAEQFAMEVLASVEADAEVGRKTLASRFSAEARRRHPRQVSELAAESTRSSAEYLLGAEPTWADVREGLAVRRDCDDMTYAIAADFLASTSVSPPMVITGTAGSGKSTSIMRLALRLSADGVPVYWLDEQSNVEPSGLRELVAGAEGSIAILLDDAEVFGRLATMWARDIPQIRPQVLVVLAIRSNRIDGVLDADSLGLTTREVVMPHLADRDIDGLIEVLEKHNRLGQLRALNHQQRVAIFRNEAGRQLLVAMIKATSGKELKEKVLDEFSEMSQEKRALYALVALAHSQRFSIDRDELLLASRERDNETLAALEELVTRNILVREDTYTAYRTRHRLIADELVHAMEFRPYLDDVLKGLTFAFAARVRSDMPRTSRPWRRLIRFINHQYLLQHLPAEIAGEVYENLEDQLAWDYQYWLQRGSLQVEKGDLDLATNFLGQARSLAPTDRNVETEYAYLLVKKAARSPTHPSALDWFTEGQSMLEDLIESYGRADPHPFHILGSQGLAWSRRAGFGAVERRAFLAWLVDKLTFGGTLHPRSTDLQVLLADVRREWLSTAIDDNALGTGIGHSEVG